MVKDSDEDQRSIDARDISGVVVMGDVKGDVKQHQGSSAARTKDINSTGERPVWSVLGRVALIVGILAGLAAIAGLMLEFAS